MGRLQEFEMRADSRQRNEPLGRTHPIRHMGLMLPNIQGEFAEFGSPPRLQPVGGSEATPRREFAHSALSGAARGVRRVNPETGGASMLGQEA